MSRHVVVAVGDLPVGGRKAVTVNGRPIVVFNVGGEYFGLLNRSRIRAPACPTAFLEALRRATDPARSATPARANSFAAPGTAGSSTSAPAGPGASRSTSAPEPIRLRWPRAHSSSRGHMSPRLSPSPSRKSTWWSRS